MLKQTKMESQYLLQKTTLIRPSLLDQIVEPSLLDQILSEPPSEPKPVQIEMDWFYPEITYKRTVARYKETQIKLCTICSKPYGACYEGPFYTKTEKHFTGFDTVNY